MKNNVQLQKLPLNGKTSGLIFTFASLIPFAIVITLSFVISGIQDELLESRAWYIYLSYAITPVALLLSIFVLYTWLQRKGYTIAVGLNKFDKRYLYVIPLVAFGCIFGLGFLNTYFNNWIIDLGYKASTISPPIANVGQLFLSLLVVAVLPAVIEEWVFRGAILQGLKGTGTVVCSLLGAFAFSLFHHNPLQTIYQFLMGGIYTYLTLKSGSIFVSMVAHFINNAFIIIFSFFAGANYNYGWVQYLLIPLGLIALVGAFFLVRYISKGNAINTEEVEEEQTNQTGDFFKYGSVGIAVLVLQIILTFI